MSKLHCCICMKLLPRDCFYKNLARSSGKASRCKSCENFLTNFRYFLDRDNEKYKKRKRASSKRWMEKNRIKTKAHNTVSSAIASGKLIRPKKCQNCNDNSKLNAHHEDYRKPLKVKWLCIVCHEKAHHA